MQTTSEIEAFVAAELEPGVARARVEAWVGEGHASGRFARMENPDPALEQIVFASAELVELPEDSNWCRRPRFMVVLFLKEDKYQGCSVVDVSYRVPAGDARHYFGSDDEVAAFMHDRFPIDMARDNARVEAQKLASLLPEFTTQEGEAGLDLSFRGASVGRGFMTAQGVQQGYQALDCRTSLRFEGGRLVSAEHSATLRP